MSSTLPPIQTIFADNDGADGLRETVIGYRRQTGSGGGSGGGVEARVAKLEANVEHVQRDVQDLKQDSRELRADMRDVRERLAKLEERVSHLPGKGFIVSVVMLALAVTTGLIVFQSRIEAFVTGRPAIVATPTATP